MMLLKDIEDQVSRQCDEWQGFKKNGIAKMFMESLIGGETDWSDIVWDYPEIQGYGSGGNGSCKAV